MDPVPPDGGVYEIDRWHGGFGWVAHSNEPMQRTSHALVADDGVWVLDPVDHDGLDARLVELGDVTGVCVLFDRHTRDAATIARRHGVAVYLPAWMNGVESTLDAPVERLDPALGDYEVRRLVDNRFWQEAALYDGATLYVPETLGTISFYTTAGERVGVHPLRRLWPPAGLDDVDLERLLVGHGNGVVAEPAAAVADAVTNARRRAPRLYVEILANLLGW